MQFDFTDKKGVLFDSIGLLDFDEHVTKNIKFGVKFVGSNKFKKFNGNNTSFISLVGILSTESSGK